MSDNRERISVIIAIGIEAEEPRLGRPAGGPQVREAGRRAVALQQPGLLAVLSSMPAAFTPGLTLLPVHTPALFPCSKHPDQYRSLVKSFSEHCLHGGTAPPVSWI